MYLKRRELLTEKLHNYFQLNLLKKKKKRRLIASECFHHGQRKKRNSSYEKLICSGLHLLLNAQTNNKFLSNWKIITLRNEKYFSQTFVIRYYIYKYICIFFSRFKEIEWSWMRCFNSDTVICAEVNR